MMRFRLEGTVHDKPPIEICNIEREHCPEDEKARVHYEEQRLLGAETRNDDTQQG